MGAYGRPYGYGLLSRPTTCTSDNFTSLRYHHSVKVVGAGCQMPGTEGSIADSWRLQSLPQSRFRPASGTPEWESVFFSLNKLRANAESTSNCLTCLLLWGAVAASIGFDDCTPELVSWVFIYGKKSAG